MDSQCGVTYYVNCECPEEYTIHCSFSGFTTAVEDSPSYWELAEMQRSLSETYYTAVRAIMSDSVMDFGALEQWHAVAQSITDPYSLAETRFMMGYSEPFESDVDDAELENYAEFHALKRALRDNNDFTETFQETSLHW